VDRAVVVHPSGGLDQDRRRPGLDHISMKQELAPLADDVQTIFYDQRGLKR
jgi:hypothetical protein